MSDQTAVPEPSERCDHICLKDADHIQRGEPHFYGYEVPSPRVHLEQLNAWVNPLGSLVCGVPKPTLGEWAPVYRLTGQGDHAAD